MTLSPQIKSLMKWLKRVFLILSVFILVLIIILSVVLFFLPDAVSSAKFKDILEKQISTALDRPVDIHHVNWSWKDGITLSGLNIKDSPDFSDKSMFVLKSAALDIHFRDLIRRNINLNFIVSGLEVHIIKDSEGRINLSEIGKKSPQKPEKPKKKEKKSKKAKKKKSEQFVLPVDILTLLQLKEIEISFDDRSANRNYRIENAAVELKTGSIKNTPVTLSIELDLEVDKQSIPHSSLYLSLTRLFDKNGALNIKGLAAVLNADLPGLTANIAGDMSTSGINGEIKASIETILSAAAPFLPDKIKQSDISGALLLTASAQGIPDDPVKFNTKLTASGLAVAGQIISQKKLGPGKFEIAIDGSVDLADERLKLNSGDITILENSHIHLYGRADRFKKESRYFDMSVAPLFIDVSEVSEFIKPFMPQTIAIDHSPPSTISLDNLHIAGSLGPGSTELSIKSLDANLSGLELYPPKETVPSLILSGGQISIKSLRTSLSDLFPAFASVMASIKIDSLKKTNPNGDISINGLLLESLKAEAVDISKTDQSKFGIQTSVSIDERLTVKQIKLADRLAISSLSQSLSARAKMNPDGSAKGSLQHLKVETPQLSVQHKSFDPIKTGCSVNLSLNELSLKQLSPLLLDVNEFIARLSIEEAASLFLYVNARDTGGSWFTVNGEISSDLAKLSQKLPEELLAGVTAGGTVTLNISSKGRTPKPEEIDSLKTGQLKNNLNFIDTIHFDARLDKGNLALSQKDKPGISIGTISGIPLLEYNLNGKTGAGNLKSRIQAAGLKGVAAIAPQKPITLEIQLAGNHDYTDAIDLHQTLTIDPIGITENIDLTIDGLNRIITRRPLPKIPAWISDAGGSLKTSASIPDCSRLKELGLPGLSGLSLDGKLYARSELIIVPDNSIAGNIGLDIQNMNVALKDSIKTESVNANINLSKTYLINPDEQSGISANKPSTLSSNVIQSALERSPASGNTDIYRHIRYISERMNPSPALAFQKADISSGPFPLSIGESQVMLGLTDGLPNLDYFQFNLLDGTINGSLNIFKEETGFFLNAGLNFSGISMAEFFPEAFDRKDKSEAMISGSFYSVIPITDQLQPLLENSTIVIEFTRIGSRALERLLYSLDPYESNEAIVSQRRLLKTGSPKQIQMEIKEGFLSLRGTVSIQSIDIELPRIRRLNIARIPGIARFGNKLARLKPVIRILEIVSADTIVVSKETGMIVFKE